MSLPVIRYHNGHGLISTVVRYAVDRLALVRLGYGPFVRPGLGERHLAEACCVVLRVLGYRYLVRRKRRCTVFRRDRELKAVIRRPITTGQRLLHLHLALAGLAVGVRHGCVHGLISNNGPCCPCVSSTIAAWGSLYHSITDPCRQTGRGHCLTVAQSEVCNSVCERHATIGAVNRCTQCHREGKCL